MEGTIHMRNYWSKSVTLVGIAIQIVILAVVALFIGVWVSMPVRTLDAPLLGSAWMVARSLALGFVWACGCSIINYLEKGDCSDCIPTKSLSQVVIFIILLSLVYGGLFLLFGCIWFLVCLAAA
jgi:hypothetical protein